MPCLTAVNHEMSAHTSARSPWGLCQRPCSCLIIHRLWSCLTFSSLCCSFKEGTCLYLQMKPGLPLLAPFSSRTAFAAYPFNAEPLTRRTYSMINSLILTKARHKFIEEDEGQSQTIYQLNLELSPPVRTNLVPKLTCKSLKNPLILLSDRIVHIFFLSMSACMVS